MKLLALPALLTSLTVATASFNSAIRHPFSPGSPIFYPITSYLSSNTTYSYGSYIYSPRLENDCLSVTPDYQTADTIKISGDDLNIYSISTGHITQITNSSISAEYNLNDSSYTVNYQNILPDSPLKLNDTIDASQHIGNLKPTCPYLVLSIHDGSEINLSTSTQTASDFSTWKNPQDFLSTLQAQNPIEIISP